ncbi:nucleotide sugar dehydrogenase, partial [Myroides odoratimimus]|nr:nucleotide sugar dehydrogenase [Myroides odoratimimus]
TEDHRYPADVKRYDAVVLGVAHKELLALDITSLKKEISVVYDVKGMLQGEVDSRL